jgi:hypothetical protein
MGLSLRDLIYRNTIIYYLVRTIIKKVHPITGHEGPRGGSEGIALLILNLSARRGWMVSTTPRPLYPGNDLVPTVQEAGWAPGPVWTCAKNLVPTGIRSPDRSAVSQSLYRLSYPDNNKTIKEIGQCAVHWKLSKFWRRGSLFTCQAVFMHCKRCS